MGLLQAHVLPAGILQGLLVALPEQYVPTCFPMGHCWLHLMTVHGAPFAVVLRLP